MRPTVLPTILVGLGNPGERYQDTRHNVGFMVIDRVLRAIKHEVRQESRFSSQVVSTRYAGRSLTLMKPQTFMNLSGEAVAKAKAALGAAPEEILVVYDCLDLPLGRLRLRSQGSSGGHRGVESIIQTLGTNAFPRLRLGIGRAANAKVVDYVLSSWSAEDQPVLDKMVELAADAVLCAVRQGVDAAMNRFNQVSADPESPAQAE